MMPGTKPTRLQIEILSIIKTDGAHGSLHRGQWVFQCGGRVMTQAILILEQKGLVAIFRYVTGTASVHLTEAGRAYFNEAA